MEYLKIDKSKLKRYVDEDIYIYIYMELKERPEIGIYVPAGEGHCLMNFEV